MTLSLQEILIVGSAVEQAKFSELTMDMFRWGNSTDTGFNSNISFDYLHIFRMLQTLEREPQESYHGMPHHPSMTMTHGGPHGKRIILLLLFRFLSFGVCV